jgi:small subunit ribosomal protein S17
MAKEEKKGKREPVKAPEKARLVGTPSTRGRIFQGIVVRKFTDRIAIEFERTLFVPKYERYTKKTQRIHAKIPQGFEVHEGDLVQVQETRPLSKTIHFMLTKVIKHAEKE